MNAAPSGAVAGRRLAASLLAWLAGVAVPAAGAVAAERTAGPPSVQTIDAPFSFVRAPFVHPRILKDLTTWLSDTGDQVVAVNLTDSNWSNRYHGEVEGSCIGVTWRGREQEWFSYRYVGRTDSGVHVLRTSESGGGTMVSVMLLFAILELDYGFLHFAQDFRSLPAATPRVSGQASARVVRPDRQRILLRKLGTFGLGDRWRGDLAVRGNDVFLGEDRGWFSQAEGHDRKPPPQGRLRIEAKPRAPLDFAAHAGGCATDAPADP